MQFFQSHIDKTQDWLKELGTESIPHTRGLSLYHHLVRVKSILKWWGCDEEVQLAGLCHSLYSTAYFKKHVLDIAHRDLLKGRIGMRAERLVYLFARVNRERFSYDKMRNERMCVAYNSHESLECREDEFGALAHLLLANEIDHIQTVGVGMQRSLFKKYLSLRPLLCERARGELDKLVQEPNGSTTGTFIRFIAHSGVQLADGKECVVIDPWLFDSKRDQPTIESLDPTQRTIDYLLPEPTITARELAPDMVCLSHFHTHHSPLREIVEFAKMKPITIVCPTLDAEKQALIKQKVGDHIFGRMSFVCIEEDQEVVLGNIRVRAMMHKQGDLPHLMFHAQLHERSLVHVVDAAANKTDYRSLAFSDEWERLYNLRPDVLFVGAAGHINRNIINGVRVIQEAATLTPAQAALLAVRVMPQHAAIIGIYNHSVWDDRYEMAFGVEEAESQFYWCLSYLAPSIGVRKLLPGDVFFGQ